MPILNRRTIEIVANPESNAARDEVAEYLAEHPNGWQDENGIDLTLICANLRKTPDQRVKQAQDAARQLARMLDVRGA